MIETRFQLSEHVVVRETGKGVRMLYDQNRGVMYELNDTASAIIALLDQPRSVLSMAKLLTQEYDGSEDDFKEDIEQLLSDFKDVGLVTTVQVDCID